MDGAMNGGFPLTASAAHDRLEIYPLGPLPNTVTIENWRVASSFQSPAAQRRKCLKLSGKGV